MIRIFYIFAVVTLIASTGWAAAGMKGAREQSSGRLGIVLLVALQR
jgi:hypothetical protein